jgi:hypothetical protein
MHRMPVMAAYMGPQWLVMFSYWDTLRTNIAGAIEEERLTEGIRDKLGLLVKPTLVPETVTINGQTRVVT